MGFLENILTIIQVVLGLLVMVLVLLQEGKEGAGVITGESNKGGAMGSSTESRLANWTKWLGLAYIVFTIGAGTLMLINR